MANPLESFDEYLYRPANNAGPDLALVQRGDVYITTPSRRVNNIIQRDSIVGARYPRQTPRGNSTYSLAFTVAKPFLSLPEAEREGDRIMEYATDYPLGQLTHNSAYDEYDQPTKSLLYIATIDSCDIQPINSDYWLGFVFQPVRKAVSLSTRLHRYRVITSAAWRAVTWNLTLTQDED